MGHSTGRAFNHRAFAAAVMVMSGLGLPGTGLVVHLLQTEPMTVARQSWMAAHTSLAVVFASFAVWHAVMNGRALLNRFRGLLSRTPGACREAVCALALVGVALLLAVGHTYHLR